jgi:hypothetical protein
MPSPVVMQPMAQKSRISQEPTGVRVWVLRRMIQANQNLNTPTVGSITAIAQMVIWFHWYSLIAVPFRRSGTISPSAKLPVRMKRRISSARSGFHWIINSIARFAWRAAFLSVLGCVAVAFGPVRLIDGKEALTETVEDASWLLLRWRWTLRP